MTKIDFFKIKNVDFFAAAGTCLNIMHYCSNK